MCVSRDGPLVTLSITANAFLHHMVRNIVGTLVRVGRGEAEPRWMSQVLQGRDRRGAGMTAPAHGLYFLHADYRPAFELPVSDARLLPGGSLAEPIAPDCDIMP